MFGSCSRLNPEAPVPILEIERFEVKPGMALNVKANLEAFGLHVDVKTNEEKIIKRRYIDSKSGQHLLRVDDDVIIQPLKDFGDVSKYDAIVISDYGKGFVTASMVQKLRKEFNGPIFVDTKNKNLTLFEGCIVKINELEYNTRYTTCSNLIVTRGKDGALYDGIVYPAPKVEVVDVCGAGDTFLAALTYFYLVNGSVKESIQQSIAAASISVQHSGVYTLTKEDIETL